MKKALNVLLVFGWMAAACFAYSTPVWAANEKSVNSAAPYEEIKVRLDKLIKAQNDTLQEFEDIKKELYIIKIRASR